jgi:hypothetical protein
LGLVQAGAAHSARSEFSLEQVAQTKLLRSDFGTGRLLEVRASVREATAVIAKTPENTQKVRRVRCCPARCVLVESSWVGESRSDG